MLRAASTTASTLISSMASSGFGFRACVVGLAGFRNTTLLVP
jgi:hypothetical protein